MTYIIKIPYNYVAKMLDLSYRLLHCVYGILWHGYHDKAGMLAWSDDKHLMHIIKNKIYLQLIYYITTTSDINMHVH